MRASVDWLRLVAATLFIASRVDGLLGQEKEQRGAGVERAFAARQDDAKQRELEEELRHVLHEKTECDFEKAPLREVVEYFADRHHIKIEFDRALKPAGFDLDKSVTAKFKDVKLNEALAEVLKGLKLVHVVRSDVVVITMRARATGEEVNRSNDPPNVVAKKPVRVKFPLPPMQNDTSLARVLAEPSECQFTKTSLVDVADFLTTRHNVRVQLDSAAWKDGKPDPDIEVTIKSLGTLGEVLDNLVAPLKLAYVVRDGGIEITKPDLALAEELKELRELRAKPLEKPDDPQQAALEQQFLPQFRQVLKAEISFVVAVCQPTKEQRKPIEKAGDKGMKAAMKSYADTQKQMMQGRGNQGYGDPRKLIREELTKAVNEHLTAEQAAQFKAEAEKRQAHLRHVAIHNLVAGLDKELVLTAEQRGKLVESFKTNWQENWGQSLEMFMYGEQYLPQVPEAAILPVLSETQKQVLRAKPHQNVFFGGFGFGGFMVEEALAPADIGEVEIVVPAPDVKQDEDKPD